jgi:CRISPR-associated endonuclease/helicase Cas3
VSLLAKTFADAFGAGELARLVGLWHDIGKFDPAFQDYLLRCEANPKAKGTGPDHKAAGSLLAAQHAGPMAMLIQGYHGGLRSKADLQTWLVGRRKDPVLAELFANRRPLGAGSTD